MKIHRIEITLQPCDFSDKHSELRIDVRHSNTVTTTTQILEPEDMESRFDFIFERAKKILKHELGKMETKC